MVLYCVKAHCGRRWNDAIKNPGGAFRDWIKLVGQQKEVVHTYRPVLKGEGNNAFLEMIAILTGEGAKAVHLTNIELCG